MNVFKGKLTRGIQEENEQNNTMPYSKLAKEAGPKSQIDPQERSTRVPTSRTQTCRDDAISADGMQKRTNVTSAEEHREQRESSTVILVSCCLIMRSCLAMLLHRGVMYW